MTAFLAAGLEAHLSGKLLTPSVEADSVLFSLPLGERVAGRVLEALPDGRMRVAVGRLQYAMRLPTSVVPGQRVNLIYTGDDPRPTFLLSRSGAATVGVLGTLSSGAQQLTALHSSSSALPAADAGAVATVTAARPLLPAPGLPRALAAALEQAVANSGLFYEAQQARWVQGEGHLLERLKRDPRNRPLRLEVDQRPGAPAGSAGSPLPSKREEAAPLESLLRGQLQALETGRFCWHGEVWPGFTVAWEIETERPEDADREHGYGETEACWRTRLVLALPRLGRVDARVTLRADTVQVSLRPSSPETARALASARKTLEEALSSIGLRPASVQVLHGD